jgi:hypothetical protein
MITLKQARKILKSGGVENISDEQLQVILNFLYNLSYKVTKPYFDYE